MSFKADKRVAHGIFSIFSIVFAYSNNFNTVESSARQIRSTLFELDLTGNVFPGPAESLDNQFFITKQNFDEIARIWKNLKREKSNENLASFLRFQQESEKRQTMEKDHLEKLSILKYEYATSGKVRMKTQANGEKQKEGKVSKVVEKKEKKEKTLIYEYVKTISENLQWIRNQKEKYKKAFDIIRGSKESSKDIRNRVSGFPYLKTLIPSSNQNKKSSDKVKTTKRENNPLSSNKFTTINNYTQGNQYQIGNIFIFNESSDKKMGKHKNVKWMSGVEEGFPVSGSLEDSTGPPSFEDEQFSHQNDLISQQILQMVKIVDFVERYHGILNGLKESEEILWKKQRTSKKKN